MKRLVVLVLALGCGDNLPDPGTPHSGGRLRLGWWVYADGTRQLETSWYYDSALRQRCVPSDWSDGNRYCAPATDEAVYTSASCTAALGRTPIDAAPAPYFATTFYLKGEPLRSRVFERGPQTDAPLTVFQKFNDGCYPTELGDGFAYFELGREITNLARLRRGEPRGAGELAVVDDVSDDGLRVPVTFYDRALGVECTAAARANVDSVECAPNDSAIVSYFHEVGCLEPELAITGTVPTTAKQYSPLTRCWSYYDVGTEVNAPPLYEALGGTCTSVSPPNGSQFFLVAGLHQLQGVLRQREVTTRRLAAIDLVRDDQRFADPLLYDSALATECWRDENDRCVPATDATIEPFFADSGCTMPLDLALVPQGECDAPTKFARKGDEYHPLGLWYTRTIFWLSTGDTCGIYRPPTPFNAWTVGPAIDPTMFATATLTIDR
ncbi:MAG TPA: hypothetical protein VFV99_20735 [Kofleriaceae bacterium]|nr:hypothetical protein [Kofleriaceae bacterium]